MPDRVDLSDHMDLIALGQASPHDLLADKGCGSRRPSGGSLPARAKLISHDDGIGFTELIRLAYQYLASVWKGRWRKQICFQEVSRLSWLQFHIGFRIGSSQILYALGRSQRHFVNSDLTDFEGFDGDKYYGSRC
jgi:hypothetical protein